MNPTADQEEKQSGSILLSIMPSINEISNIVESGTSDSSLIVKVPDNVINFDLVVY